MKELAKLCSRTMKKLAKLVNRITLLGNEEQRTNML